MGTTLRTHFVASISTTIAHTASIFSAHATHLDLFHPHRQYQLVREHSREAHLATLLHNKTPSRQFSCIPSEVIRTAVHALAPLLIFFFGAPCDSSSSDDAGDLR